VCCLELAWNEVAELRWSGQRIDHLRSTGDIA